MKGGDFVATYKGYTGTEDVLKKIATYHDDFRSTAEKLHKTIMSTGVTLYPRLWYGMPGYAKTESGAVLVYFRKDKYITVGQTESSHIDFDTKTNSQSVAWYFTELNDGALRKITDIRTQRYWISPFQRQ
jgi:hypothetical protein